MSFNSTVLKRFVIVVVVMRMFVLSSTGMQVIFVKYHFTTYKYPYKAIETKPH